MLRVPDVARNHCRARARRHAALPFSSDAPLGRDFCCRPARCLVVGLSGSAPFRRTRRHGLSEYAVEQKVAFLLTWGLLNFFWLGCTRRPAISAALSLGMIALLIGLSMLKYKVLWMTVDFVDLMIIDPDSIAFLYSIFPNLGWTTILCTGRVASVLVLLWRVDVFRMSRLGAAAGAAGCLVALTALSFAVPLETYETFYGANYVSHFARSGVEAIYEFGDPRLHGVGRHGRPTGCGSSRQTACDPVRKPPHIIMVHDESSFDIRALPGVRVPRGYGAVFPFLRRQGAQLHRRGRRRPELVHRI